jgi:hypothetical protein
MNQALAHVLFFFEVLLEAALTIALFVALARLAFNRRGAPLHIAAVFAAFAVLQVMDTGAFPGLVSLVLAAMFSGPGSTFGFMPVGH